MDLVTILKNYVSPDKNSQITGLSASGKLTSETAGVLWEKITSKDNLAVVRSEGVTGLMGTVNILDLPAKAVQLEDGKEPDWTSDSSVGRLKNLGYEVPLQAVKLFATLTNEEIKKVVRGFGDDQSIEDKLLELFAKKLRNEIWRIALTGMAPGYPDTDPTSGSKPFNSMHGFISQLLNAGTSNFFIPFTSGVPNRVSMTGNILNDMNSILSGHNETWLDEYEYDNMFMMSASTRRLLDNAVKSAADTKYREYGEKIIESYSGFPIVNFKYLKKYASGNQGTIIFGYPKAMFVFMNIDGIERGAEYKPNAFAWNFSYRVQMAMGLIPELFSIVVADTDSDSDVTDEGIKIPDTPTGLVAKSNDTGQVDLAWNAANNAESYTVDYSLSATFNTWSSVTVTDKTVEISGLTSGSKYYFRVRANSTYGSSTVSSGYSSVASATIQ